MHLIVMQAGFADYYQWNRLAAFSALRANTTPYSVQMP